MHKLLLIDDSLTVQKVVALTLDKSRYALFFAKTRAEAMQRISESMPDLVMVSDQVKDVTAASFPKEVESWLGQLQSTPPIVLITSRNIDEHRHYAGVLKKPFTPRDLQSVVEMELGRPEMPAAEDWHRASTVQGNRFESKFNERPTHEGEAVRPTSSPAASRPVVSGTRSDLNSLWGATETASSNPAPVSNQVPTPPTASGASPTLEEAVDPSRLNEVVDQVLNRIVPPIVERLVKERLDRLLQDQEPT